MGSPLLWGPNNISNNLQGSLLLSDGTLIDYNGPKNYITLGNFENQATTGWSLGTVGTLTNGLPTGTPTFGSGAAVSLSTAITTSANLALNASLQLISSAATTQGNMIASQAYAIDRADQARVLTVQFSFAATVGAAVSNFSGTSSNSWAWAVWDVTNSSWLTSAGNFNLVQNSGTGYCTGTVQTNSTTASIRLVIYAANATTGAVTLTLDQFYVGPQTAPMGPAMSDWVAYTPTLTGFGTATSVEFQWARVGSDVLIRGKFASGTSTATEARISLPAGMTAADTTKIPSIQVAGTGGRNIANGAYSIYMLIEPSVTYLTVGAEAVAFAALTKLQGSAFINSTDVFAFFARIPIQGWSSNTVSSADTDTRVIQFYTHTCAAATPNTTTKLINSVVLGDNTGSYSTSTGLFTAPVSGIYQFSAGYFLSTGAANPTLYFFKNGTQYGNVFGGTGAANYAGVNGSQLIPLNAGDTVGYYANSGGTGVAVQPQYANFGGIRLSGPAVVQATESVNMRYFNSAGTNVTGTTDIPFATRGFDSHNAFSSPNYTVPVSGKYFVTSTIIQGTSVTWNANGGFNILLYKNGSLNSAIGGVATLAGSVSLQAAGSTIIDCNAGDVLKIAVQTSNAFNMNSTSASSISIVRVGN